MNTVQAPEARREHRVEISSIVLPFLGLREDDYSPFQYLLGDLSMHGARILLPRWSTRRELLAVEDEVDFQVPFRFAGETYSVGDIAWQRWDEAQEAQVCGVHFARKTPQTYPVAISFEAGALDIDLTHFNTESDLMLRVLKDAVLLKRGIAIYLKHLSPYLSRISGEDKAHYAFLRSFLLEDAARHVRANRLRLEQVYTELQGGVCSQAELAACLSVEDLLDAFEPEIPADVFAAAFVDKAVAPYVRSIKVLEKKLYVAYNTLMLLYISSIQ